MEYQASKKGMELGRNLVNSLKRGEIREAVRPNSAENYTGSPEEMDFLQYIAFLKSYTYKDLFDNVEVEYGRF
ncbi:MAG: hypothetical protein HFI34_08590 [Lachnospiraceae bacterium]|nr:hypothetical protein [Lachnospiraceae bacterium]